eukprot:GEZU01001461.1.p1 GENE.GEZU01001461.1~~GEZU01001461.1.p1  ORF type:complete len:268 (-),score=47.60 GEZU01001461.1:40-801(-)
MIKRIVSQPIINTSTISRTVGRTIQTWANSATSFATPSRATTDEINAKCNSIPLRSPTISRQNSPLRSPIRAYAATAAPLWPGIEGGDKRGGSSGMDEINLISVEADKTFCSSIGPLSMTVNNVRLFGSVILLPRHTFLWKVPTLAQLNKESLRIFELLQPLPDILLIGTGEKKEHLSNELVAYFAEIGINVETMSSVHAASTFNILNQEDRNVAAAIISEQPVDFDMLTPAGNPQLFRALEHARTPDLFEKK